MTPGLAQFALSEYEARKEAVALALASKRMDEAAADASVWLWLSIAVRSGADHPDMYTKAIYPRGERVKLWPCQMADVADCIAELSRARDVAANNAKVQPNDLWMQQRAWDLDALAIHHRCPPSYALEEQEAA